MKAADIAAIEPVASSHNGECLLLTVDGTLFRIDPIRGVSHRLMDLCELDAPLSTKYALQVSPCGDFAAIVEARGQRGVVLDLATGTITMSLDRGDYHPEQTDFPVAFFKGKSGLRPVHGTDWSRLDISDPRTGVLFTDRSPTSYQRGKNDPSTTWTTSTAGWRFYLVASGS